MVFESIYILVGLVLGSICGKIAYQLIMIKYDEWIDSRLSYTDTDKMRRDFERTCNSVIYELHTKQKKEYYIKND